MGERYYAKGNAVFAHPIKTERGTTLGFRVCTADCPENAVEIARCLNQDDAIEAAGNHMPGARKDYPVSVGISCDRLLVAVGTELLQFAVMHQPELAQFQITDRGAFLEELARELTREQGDDGTSLIQIAFDRAALNVVENGAACVQEMANG